jgi:hypothetical protein
MEAEVAAAAHKYQPLYILIAVAALSGGETVGAGRSPMSS